jgi:hypothetical protein
METDLNDVLWQAGDSVTDLDTGATGTVIDAGDGNDLDTMTIVFDD